MGNPGEEPSKARTWSHAAQPEHIGDSQNPVGSQDSQGNQSPTVPVGCNMGSWTEQHILHALSLHENPVPDVAVFQSKSVLIVSLSHAAPQGPWAILSKGTELRCEWMAVPVYVFNIIDDHDVWWCFDVVSHPGLMLGFPKTSQIAAVLCRN